MENWSGFDWIIFFVSMWLCYRIIVNFQKIEKVRKELVAHQAEEIVRAMIIPSVMEFYKGQVFLYNKDTGKFITQASTEDELKVKLNQLFPRKAFIVVESTVVPD
jgi:hypothetical protein